MKAIQALRGMMQQKVSAFKQSNSIKSSLYYGCGVASVAVAMNMHNPKGISDLSKCVAMGSAMTAGAYLTFPAGATCSAGISALASSALLGRSIMRSNSGATCTDHDYSWGVVSSQ